MPEAESVLSVRAAIAAAKVEPQREAYARIVGDGQPIEALTDRHSGVTGLPAVSSEASRRFTAPFDGGAGSEGHEAASGGDD